MSLLRTSRRIIHLLAIAAVFSYSILEVLLTRPRTRALRAAWLSRICHRLLRPQHITVTAIGPIPAHGAIISNHLTYADIAVLATIQPCVFVSKIELRSTPVFGWISMMAGTVYINRKAGRTAGRSASKAAEGMAKGFRDALPVVFFPEGTTSLGDAPTLPFRSGLLAMALAAGEPITAAFIHYELSPADLAAGYSTHNDVHWGKQTLFQHVWNFVGLTNVHATIHFADQPIAFSEAALHNRKQAGREAQAAVEALAIPLQQPTPGP
ncbi:MAG: lysophospholipid acyltransferase family protein [Acidobacteriaceae bacterium]